MNLLLFITIILIAFIIVRIGAIAFEITGLEWSLAKFQSLSCFSGTGFTTKESELVTSDPQRRRIASVLIVLGNAGLVSMIATFANTLRGNPLIPRFKIPFINLDLSSKFLPWLNFALVVLVVYGIYKVFTLTKLPHVFTDAIRRQIQKKGLIKPVTFEELMIATGGYGISQIEIDTKSILIGKTLLESRLREHDISVLTLEQDGHTVPNPPPHTQFKLHDKIICFGKLENIRKKLCTPESS